MICTLKVTKLNGSLAKSNYRCGDCFKYLKRGLCPKAIYKKTEENRVACAYGDKICSEFQRRGQQQKLESVDLTPLPHLRFSGPEYDSKLDRIRLTGQIFRIFNLMKDEVWRTLSEIERVTDDPQASISAQLRHLRKARFGYHIVNKRRRGMRT